MAVGWFMARFEEISYLLVPGMLIVVAIAFIGTRNERLPFYLLVASLPLLAFLRKTDQIPHALLIIPGGLAMLAWLVQLAIRRTTILFDRSTALAVLVGIWAIMSAISAGTRMIELSNLQRYWEVIILLFLTQNLLRERQHLVQFGWVMAISLSLYGAWIFGYQAQTYLQSGGSFTAMQLHLSTRDFAQINVSGMWINTGIPFAFYLMILAKVKQSRRRTYLLALCVILMILGVLSTFSVGAALGLGITLALLVLWMKNRSHRVRLTLLGLVVIGAALLSPLGERFNDQLLALAEKDPIEWGTYRGLSFYIGVQTIRQFPLFGGGPGGTGMYGISMEYMPFDSMRQVLFNGKPPLTPHNMFLYLGAELGIPGLLAFLALLTSIMLPLWREIRRQGARSGDTTVLYMGQAVLISLIVLLAHGMGHAGQIGRYLWILLGVGLAFTRISKRDSQVPTPGKTYSRTRVETNKYIGKN